MENEKMKKQELQSRRDFFKKAAKGVLPILGAVVLASSPLLSQAAEKAPMGCDYSCYNSCSGACTSSCTGCGGGCGNTCYGTCKGDCDRNCFGTCYKTCSGSSR